MNVPKNHFLLHMLEDSLKYGPVDNYSLQAPENQHIRDVKRLVPLTNRGADSTQQVITFSFSKHLFWLSHDEARWAGFSHAARSSNCRIM